MIFTQPTLGKECKSFQFTMIIDFYAHLLKKKVHISVMKDAYIIFISFTSKNRCRNHHFAIRIDFYAFFFEKGCINLLCTQ